MRSLHRFSHEVTKNKFALTPTLPGFLLNDATSVIQNWLRSRLFADIFFPPNLIESILENSRYLSGKFVITIFVESTF